MAKIAFASKAAKDSLQLFRLVLTSPFHVALPPQLARKVFQKDFGIWTFRPSHQSDRGNLMGHLVIPTRRSTKGSHMQNDGPGRLGTFRDRMSNLS